MEQISRRLAILASSQTLAMSQKSNELKAAGKDVINLSVGEPDFNTPDYVKDAAKKAIDDNYSFYSPVGGYKELLQAISDKLKRENNLDYGLNQIVVSAGAKHSISNVCLSILNPGDEVIVLNPSYVSYSPTIKLAGGVPVYINLKEENRFKLLPEDLENAITDKTIAPTTNQISIYTFLNKTAKI